MGALIIAYPPPTNLISWKSGWEKRFKLIFYLMELFESLKFYIGPLLFFAINHYFVKDSKKMLKYTFLVMLPFIAILVLGMEFGCIPSEL